MTNIDSSHSRGWKAKFRVAAWEGQASSLIRKRYLLAVYSLGRRGLVSSLAFL